LAGVEKTSNLATRELRAGRWERDIRSAFLEAYTAEVDDDAPGILPEDTASVSAMIALFETEKAFDDLTHELNDRAASVWIPMRGIAKLLAR
jgi:predicted trehalose synthase